MSALFFVLAAGMVALALALVAPSLFSPPRGAAAESGRDEEVRRRENIAAARRRMRELRARRERGEISEEDFSESRAEIERALLDDLAAESESRVEKTGRKREDSDADLDSVGMAGRRKWTAAIVCALLPIAAGALYLHLGEPRAILGAEQAVGAGGAGGAGAPSMDSAIGALRERLEDNPEDASGWVLLARSLATVGRFSEAAEAFSRAGALVGEDADILASEAEVRARAAGGDFSGVAERLLARALEADAENPTALWLSGLAATGRGDHRAAADFWRRALPGVEDPEGKAQLRQLIARAESESGLAESAPAESASAPAPTDSGEEEGGAVLEVAVSLSPDLSADSGDVVFIFARAVSGPRIPLAAAKRGVGELPFVLSLTDAMAMTPQLKLSQFEEVDIVARISKSGTPQASPGDLYGEAKKVSVSDGGKIAVVIDRRVE